jgi:hypothetical protein
MMKNDPSITARPMPAPAQNNAEPPISDLANKQRQFADALDKARAKPLPLRPKQAEDLPVGALMTVASGYAAINAAPTATASSNDAAFAAHLERIAAAIAELAASGVNADVHVQLPPGATGINGAVLGRNSLGQIHVVLTTAAAIPPTTAAQLQSQLSERLLRRDIKIAKIGIQRIGRQA